ncbi:hypothetical protein CPB86DRAFT_870511 [Serendipita vermifera]|jgi:hypothetical protein|nr:hypothetical protein CPB86DRAFT_870511 [Serendipita vermifera]
MKISIMPHLRVAWQRITVTRLTSVFVTVSLIYCILQSVLAIGAFRINSRSANIIRNIYDTQHVRYLDYVNYDRKAGLVRLCKNNAQVLNYTSCPVIFPISLATNQTASRNFTSAKNATTKHKSRVITVQLVPVQDKQGQTALNITGIQAASRLKNTKNDTIQATPVCMEVMKYPLRLLLNSKREDFTFVWLQFWVFGLSMVAILTESVPHVIASFIGHFWVAIWSAVVLADTIDFQNDYNTLIRGVNAQAAFTGALGKLGACDGQDFLPNYFGPRQIALSLVTVLNFFGLLGSGFFTYKLYHSFEWMTFRRVGASVLINRLYRLSSIFLILIQLSLFFVATAMCLWLDQLFNGVFGSKGKMLNLYKGFHFVLFVFLLPWIILGWIGVRKEKRIKMWIFFALSIVFIVCWSAECFSISWRLTFKHWPFFASIQTCAFVFMFFTFIFGIICRVNFGRGLLEYLEGTEKSSNEDDLHATPDVASDDVEKVDFPRLQALGDEEAGVRNGEPSHYHQRVDSEATLSDPSANNGKWWKPGKNDEESK